MIKRNLVTSYIPRFLERRKLVYLPRPSANSIILNNKIIIKFFYYLTYRRVRPWGDTISGNFKIFIIEKKVPLEAISPTLNTTLHITSLPVQSVDDSVPICFGYSGYGWYRPKTSGIYSQHLSEYPSRYYIFLQVSPSTLETFSAQSLS